MNAIACKTSLTTLVSLLSFEHETGYVQKLLIDNGLTTALNESGVKDPVLLKAAKAMFSGQSQVKIDGDNRIAMIGDKSINDYIKEWSLTDEGKYFVAAPQNKGGGASGGGTSAGSKTIPMNEFNAMKPADRAKIISSGISPVE
jgi:hypothetical protein